MGKLNVVLAVQYLKGCSLSTWNLCWTHLKELHHLVLRWNIQMRSREPGNSREVSNFFFSLKNPFSKWGLGMQLCSGEWRCSAGDLGKHGGGSLCCKTLCILFSLRSSTNTLFHATKWPFWLGFFGTPWVFFWESILLVSNWLLFLRMHFNSIKWKLSRAGHLV